MAWLANRPVDIYITPRSIPPDSAIAQQHSSESSQDKASPTYLSYLISIPSIHPNYIMSGAGGGGGGGPPPPPPGG
ncbi:hypothetical protein KXX11_001687, partial [Aspergillus fumigatus]